MVASIFCSRYTFYWFILSCRASNFLPLFPLIDSNFWSYKKVDMGKVRIMQEQSEGEVTTLLTST